jgi:hypothetical protein
MGAGIFSKVKKIGVKDIANTLNKSKNRGDSMMFPHLHFDSVCLLYMKFFEMTN